MPLKIKEVEAPIKTRLGERRVIDSGAAAIAMSTEDSDRRFRLVNVTVKFDILPTTSERITLTLRTVDGPAYGAVLASADPSVGFSTGDVVFQGEENDVFNPGDFLDLAYTNTDTRTYGARIVTEVID